LEAQTHKREKNYVHCGQKTREKEKKEKQRVDGEEQGTAIYANFCLT
jgi:Zn ribbon nucleic-acid-binding protein